MINFPSHLSNPWNNAVAYLEMFDGTTALASGSSFFWLSKGRTFLVTNWRSLSGKNPLTNDFLSGSRTVPNQISFGVAFSPDGKILASGSGDKTVKLWDLATGTELRTIDGHSGEIRSVVFSPDGRTLMSGSADATVKVWDVSDHLWDERPPQGAFMVIEVEQVESL